MPRKIDDAYFACVKARLPAVEKAASMRAKETPREGGASVAALQWGGRDPRHGSWRKPVRHNYDRATLSAEDTVRAFVGPLTASPPYSSLERDFCRRRLARQKGPEDDVSVQRPEIRDHHTREMAGKAAFLPASHQLQVSGDWVVGEPGLEPGTR
jgi:hypothetical protein